MSDFPSSDQKAAAVKVVDSTGDLYTVYRYASEVRSALGTQVRIAVMPNTREYPFQIGGEVVVADYLGFVAPGDDIEMGDEIIIDGTYCRIKAKKEFGSNSMLVISYGKEIYEASP